MAYKRMCDRCGEEVKELKLTKTIAKDPGNDPLKRRYGFAVNSWTCLENGVPHGRDFCWDCVDALRKDCTVE